MRRITGELPPLQFIDGGMRQEAEDVFDAESILTMSVEGHEEPDWEKLSALMAKHGESYQPAAVVVAGCHEPIFAFGLMRMEWNGLWVAFIPQAPLLDELPVRRHLFPAASIQEIAWLEVPQ